MRNLLMIAAFAVFTACASQSDTDVGETTPQTDEATVDANDTDETQGQRPEEVTPPPADETTTTPPSTGYEPQPSSADTIQQDTSTSGTWSDTSSTTTQPSAGEDPSATPPSTGAWDDTSTSPSTGTTTDSMMTTAPDSL